MLVISNQPRATHLANLKLLTRLLPELYSTQSKLLLILIYYVHVLFTSKLILTTRKLDDLR